MSASNYPPPSEILGALNERGYFILQSFYDQQFCQTAVEHINQCSFKYFVEGDGKDRRCWHFERHSTNASTFLSSDFLSSLCVEFVGTPLLNSRCQAGIVRGDWGAINSGGGWHVDNHEKQLKALLYLTDVTELNGPFYLLPSSAAVHKNIPTYPKVPGDRSQTRYHEEVLRKNMIWENKQIITGRAGDVILVDTSNIHCGGDIVEGARYTLTNYYYNASPPSS